MKELVLEQRDEVIRALSGRGNYQLCRGYEHLQVSPQEWAKITPDQRKRHIKKFDDAYMRNQISHRSSSGRISEESLSASYSLPSEPSSSNENPNCTVKEKYLSVLCEDSEIENIPCYAAFNVGES